MGYKTIFPSWVHKRKEKILVSLTCLNETCHACRYAFKTVVHMPNTSNCDAQTSISRCHWGVTYWSLNGREYLRLAQRVEGGGGYGSVMIVPKCEEDEKYVYVPWRGEWLAWNCVILAIANAILGIDVSTCCFDAKICLSVMFCYRHYLV